MEQTIDSKLAVNKADPRYMTVQELATYLNVSRYTVWRRVKNREITYISLGPRSKRFDRAVVDKEMQERTVHAKF